MSQIYIGLARHVFVPDLAHMLHASCELNLQCFSHSLMSPRALNALQIQLYFSYSFAFVRVFAKRRQHAEVKGGEGGHMGLRSHRLFHWTSPCTSCRTKSACTRRSNTCAFTPNAGNAPALALVSAEIRTSTSS